MIDLKKDGYTHNQVKNVLHMKHGSRKVRFRYFLLDNAERELAELTTIEGGSVEQSAFAEIKRTARFNMKDSTYKKDGKTHEINFNKDRIQVFIEFKMPEHYEQNINEFQEYFINHATGVSSEATKREKGWISYSLGIFLLATPVKKEEGSSTYREIEAYDKLLTLKDDKISERYTISKGTLYYTAIRNVILSSGNVKINIENNYKTLRNTKEYEPGTSKLQIVNDLLSDIGFTPIWVDEYGYFRSSQYQSPAERREEYNYFDDDMSITLPGMEEEIDMFEVPNVFTVYVANPDNPDEIISSTIENNNPEHPRSIPNINRRVVRYEEKDDVADSASLDAYTERLAFEATQIYGYLRFSTAIMPFHSYSNVLRIRNKALNIDDKYSETNWEIPLEAGGEMSHEVRRVVSLI